MKQLFKKLFVAVFCLFLFISYLPAQASEPIPDDQTNVETDQAPEITNIDLDVIQCSPRYASITWNCDD